ncbi:hypothetical protein H6G74_28110 [Nostoc spongiaeforme FACHB-130]|uniref:Uncharacterized protein n=1 Tax=Nostoc spongiaeforme FACHB-130 TaxID=1357510 RepID=A0ABR8G4Q3_9NOSO|nr:hypothetical protein [Nostoc spongiaeforme FACHB-130]
MDRRGGYQAQSNLTAIGVLCLAPKTRFFRGHSSLDTTDTKAQNPYTAQTPRDTTPDTAQTPSVSVVSARHQ